MVRGDTAKDPADAKDKSAPGHEIGDFPEFESTVDMISFLHTLVQSVHDLLVLIYMQYQR